MNTETAVDRSRVPPTTAQPCKRDSTAKAAAAPPTRGNDAPAPKPSAPTAATVACSPDPLSATDRYRLVMPIRFLP